MICLFGLLWNWLTLCVLGIVPLVICEKFLYLVNVDITFITSTQWVSSCFLCVGLCGIIMITSLGDRLYIIKLKARNLTLEELAKFELHFEEAKKVINKQLRLPIKLSLKIIGQLYPYIFAIGRKSIIITKNTSLFYEDHELNIQIIQQILYLYYKYSLYMSFVNGTFLVHRLNIKGLTFIAKVFNRVKLFFPKITIFQWLIYLIEFIITLLHTLWEKIIMVYNQHTIKKLDEVVIKLGYQESLLSYLSKAQALPHSRSWFYHFPEPYWRINKIEKKTKKRFNFI